MFKHVSIFLAGQLLRVRYLVAGVVTLNVVLARERARDRETERQRQRETERGRES